MNKDTIKYGNIYIFMPDESSNCFYIFEDLAEQFGVKYQSEAVSLLRAELKNRANIKPKPTIDYEADNTSISSRSANTIFKVVEIINGLSISQLQATLTDEEKETIFLQLKAWKKPKKKKWQVGDVFSMELKDGSFMFGQVIGWQTIGTHVTKSPTCAVFELRKQTASVSEVELKNIRIITTQNIGGEYLDKGMFPVILKTELLTDSKFVDQYSIGGDSHLVDLGNAYWALEPWNVWGDNRWFDEMLLPNINRPKNALILDKEARNKYRLEVFGINENNERVQL